MAGRPVGRVGVDSAGGVVTGIMSSRTKIQGYPVVCIGAAIASHGSGDHANAVMVTGSSKTFANGHAVCGVGDLASCGHTLSSGSSKTSVT